MFTPRWVRTLLLACVAAAATAPLNPAPASAQDAAPQVSPVSPPAPTPRTITVTVTDDKGRYIAGLGREAFAVSDGGRPSEVVSLDFGDEPVTVVVLLDASGSMLGDGGNSAAGFAAVRNALLRFFRNCNASNEFVLIAFNRSAQLLLDSSNDPAAVLSALDRYAASKPSGPTALYDALYLALARAERGRHRKRAVLLITDGGDNSSRYTFQDVRRLLRASDATLYAVGLPTSGGSVLDYGGRSVLGELTGVSGGRAIFPQDLKGLYAAAEAAAFELRSQYTVGFVPAPTAKKDGWHGVRVRVTAALDERGRKVTPVVRAREGFYDLPPARR